MLLGLMGMLPIHLLLMLNKKVKTPGIEVPPLLDNI